jgi:hypothetical protein
MLTPHFIRKQTLGNSRKPETLRLKPLVMREPLTSTSQENSDQENQTQEDKRLRVRK